MSNLGTMSQGLQIVSLELDISHRYCVYFTGGVVYPSQGELLSTEHINHMEYQHSHNKQNEEPCELI